MKIAIVVPVFTRFVRSNEFYLAKVLEEFGQKVKIITITAKSAIKVCFNPIIWSYGTIHGTAFGGK